MPTGKLRDGMLRVLLTHSVTGFINITYPKRLYPVCVGLLPDILAYAMIYALVIIRKFDITFCPLNELAGIAPYAKMMHIHSKELF